MCGERVQIVHEASSPYEITDLTAACDLHVIIVSDPHETPRRYERDGYGLVGQVTLRSLEELPHESMIAVASWVGQDKETGKNRARTGRYCSLGLT